MTFREPLPDGCPPEDAVEIVTPQTVFRLVRTNPPTSDDFRSQRANRPSASFGGITECVARGLSVFVARQDATKTLQLARFRGCLVCEVQLRSGAGYIKQTGNNASHHTWWPLAEYNILAQCTVEDS